MWYVRVILSEITCPKKFKDILFGPYKARRIQIYIETPKNNHTYDIPHRICSWYSFSMQIHDNWLHVTISKKVATPNIKKSIYYVVSVPNTYGILVLFERKVETVITLICESFDVSTCLFTTVFYFACFSENSCAFTYVCSLFNSHQASSVHQCDCSISHFWFQICSSKVPSI